MNKEKLRIYKNFQMNDGKLLLGFSGWMDSGEVSTSTVRFFIEKLNSELAAEIETEGFYIEHFPGTMEFSSLFRPYTRISEGLVKYVDWSRNQFFCSPENNILFFLGREPNLGWVEFSEYIFSVCRQFGIKRIYFIGSVTGLVPHTREPKFTCSFSDGKLWEELSKYGLKASNYEGPASIVTYLTAEASKKELEMASVVGVVPAYVQGANPICIEASIKRIASLLGIHIDLEELLKVSDEFDKRLSEVVSEQPELAVNVRKLEENYDNEVFEEEMGDLKEWLLRKGVRLD